MEGDMAYITQNVEVEVYLDEFHDDEIIDEIIDRGYEVYNKGEVKKTSESEKSHMIKDISDLYSTYTTCSRELFEKQLKKFFSEHLNVVP
jgi:hypothetical protein